ncbi:hypothetical protein GCM10023184_09630 [Flaviaesturariibacter amylovorans]|uniref:DUF4394 domain-containing protein n=2 Tax=Flaviaesturariibacter amylovorans TaxID=1084520 RepID=A0ABP8GET0_9BACT
MPPPTVVKPDQIFFGVSASNQLLRFNANAVETATATMSISGLAAGESILGIDFRPATGELYAVTNTSRLYIINTATGAARIVGSAAFTPALTGSAVAFDFNPTVDRIRLVGSDGQNLRLNPETGAVAATDGVINGAAGASISGAAYSGNTAGSGSTVLYDIDRVSGKLYRQNPPNNGTLVEIGSLGVGAITGAAGFDIAPNGAVALASLTVGGQNNLYQIDTTSGKATLLGTFSAANAVAAIAIPTNPVAYAVDDMNNLLIFDATATTSPAIITKPITGMAASETVLGIDIRPLNGQIYALGSTSRLYTINAASGAATAVGAGPFATLLSGTSFGFDFNPTVDRIRVVSDNGQNLRLHPDLGTVVFVDGTINPGMPNLSAAAYTNNFAGAATTVLYVMDHTADKLYTQVPPNNGTLVETGALGVNIDAANGFDIGSTTGKAYGIFTVGGARGLYSINLTSGMATKTADFSRPVRGFTLGLSL